MACRNLFAWATLALIGLAVPSMAQQPTAAQQNAIKQSCRSDFQAHCSGVSPGGSAALSCLQQNASVVSAPCQKALAAVSGGGTSSAQTPATTAPATGTTAPATGGAAAPQGSATPATPATPPPPPLSPRQEIFIVRQACGGDFQRYCQGVPLGGGRAIGCLASHRATLSQRCRGALASAHQ